MEESDLNSWAVALCQSKANIEWQHQQRKKKSSFFGFLDDENKDKKSLISEAVLEKLATSVESEIKLEEQIQKGEYAQTMQNVPKFCVIFELGHLTLTLVNED